MSRVVFDIETIGVDFDELSEDAQNYLLKNSDDEKKTKEVKEKTGLNPLTGQVVAICLYNLDTSRGKVFFQAPGKKIKPVVEGEFEYQAMGEKEILENFWQEIKKYGQFITFNGRRFDCPYIIMRSAALKIRPTRNLMPYRYSDQEHIDLLDQLSFYTSFRGFSLDFYCKSFNLKHAKMEGMSGDQVQKYFKDGRHEDIARYCAADVLATAELFELWNKYIKI